ncbi:MAG: hydroxymethylbilane synthase [Gammaproteobacteria bacterium]|nr:hydroxymethylbilane synthase [Gammaproteobacteria bacterium]
MFPSVIRIATRKSPLALVQAQCVADKLQAHYPSLKIEFLPLTTEGDRHLSSRLIEVGGKGFFVKELEQALLNHEADIAVHSMKDVTMHFPPGLVVPVICERADPRDVLVTLSGGDLSSLLQGARVGTASLRRQSQLLAFRPDLQVVTLRGNVNTRLQRLEEGQFDALVVAAAGLERLGFASFVSSQEAHSLVLHFHVISTELCLPAPGQGALGLECREDDVAIQQLIAPLNDPETRDELMAERAFAVRLNGGCRAPIAAYAQVRSDRLCLRGLIAQPDGARILRGQKEGLIDEASSLGELLAEELLTQGGQDILSTLNIYDDKHT